MKVSELCSFDAMIVLSVLLRSAFCADVTDAKDLRTKLFVTDGYDKKIRPIRNQSDPIEVYVSLNLMAINELSETTETLKATGFLWIFWEDEFLQWDPSDYGGLNSYYWPQGDVWKPDVALKNSYLEYKELGVPSLNVFASNDGFIQWYPYQVFQSTCSVNLKYYPFDEQVCELRFDAWSYSVDEVRMVSGEKGIEMNQYEPNSEWDVINTSYFVDKDAGDPYVVFRIKIKRKPLHVLLSVILPIMMLAILIIFVFVLPSDGGEKASYAMTAFLAFAVFLSIVSATFPENSEVVAVFPIYLIIQTLQSTMISLIALLLIRFVSYNDDNTPIPKCLQTTLRMIRCIPCRNLKGQKRVSKVGVLSTIGNSNDKSEGIEDPEGESPKEVLYSDYSWKEVVNILDRIFFVVFSLILIISTTACFIIASGNSLD